MKWTNERKIAVGLLGLALAAFLGDRLLLQEPEPEAIIAAAPQGESRTAVVTQPVSQGQSAATAALPMAALSQKMEDVCLVEGLVPGRSRDAFTPPASWFPAPPPVVAAAPAASPSRAAEFRSKYRLTAIMRSGLSSTDGLAVIQGETVRVGQAVGGFRLTAVKEQSVILHDGTEQVELALPVAGVASMQ